MSTLADSAVDFAPVINQALKVGIMVMAYFVTKYGTRAVASFEARTNLHIDDQQKAQFLSAIHTGAGVIETLLDQKVMAISHVTIENDHIRDQARIALDALGPIANDLNLTVDNVANSIIGAVDTGPRTPVTMTALTVTPEHETV